MKPYAKVIVLGSPITKSNFKLHNKDGRAILPYNTGKPLDKYALYEEEIDLVKSGCLDPTTSGSLGLNFRYKNFRIDLGFTYTLGAHRRLPNIYRQE